MTDLLKPIVETVRIDYSADLPGEWLAKVQDLYQYVPTASVSLSHLGKTTAAPDWHVRLKAFLDDARLPVDISSDFAREFDDADLIALNKLRRVDIRINSSSPVLVAKQRGAELKTVVFNIVRLRQTMLETGKKTELCFTCTVTPENVAHVGGLARLALLLHVDALYIMAGEALAGLTDAEAWRLANSVIDAFVTTKDSRTTVSVQPALKSKLEPLISAISEGRAVTAASFKSGASGRSVPGPCLQPWTTVIARADGDVALCAGPVEAVGNLRDEPLINIVNGSSSRAFRTSMLAGGPTLPCANCEFASEDTPDVFARKVANAQARYNLSILPWQAYLPSGLDYDTQYGITTQARIFLEELDAAEIGAAAAHATHYLPTPIADLDRLLDAVPLAAEHSTFIDLGSGMGRVVFFAAQRPYRKIIGVELSPALTEVAQANLAAYRGPRACGDIELVCADATDFAYPDGDLIVYLFNPFTSAILAPVLDRLSTHEGRVVIVYNVPIEAATIDGHAGFMPLANVELEDRRNSARLWQSRPRVPA